MIEILQIIKQKCPDLKLGLISASVALQNKNTELWNDIDQLIHYKRNTELDQIKNIPEIASSREGYKALGKEPNRYRLSAEALHRRIIRGLGIYQINNIVDIINYVSLKTSYSIGGYDKDHIQGTIMLDLGRKDDIYEAIGRGIMNIENLPVFRDEIGAFGSPTSDSSRTMITNNSNNILLVYLNFGNHNSLNGAMETGIECLLKYASATHVSTEIV